MFAIAILFLWKWDATYKTVVERHVASLVQNDVDGYVSPEVLHKSISFFGNALA